LSNNNIYEEFNNKINDLINQKIQKVEYYGLRIIVDDYDNHLESKDISSYKTIHNDIHSFGIALSLHMESGDIFDIIWNNIFYCYGIEIIKNKHQDYENDAVKKWIMTDDSLWKKYINNEIMNISVLWDTNTGIVKSYKNGTEKIERIVENMKPVTLLIFFKELENRNDRLVISTSGFIDEEEGLLFRGHDNIMVINNITTALYYGLI